MEQVLTKQVLMKQVLMKQDGKLIFTRKEGRLLTLLMQEGRLQRVQAEPRESVRVGDIYIGKVKNVVHNIGAAFVDVGEGRLCFLPLIKTAEPILTNRPYDGRVLAGDEIALEITREAVKTKEAAGDTSLSFPGQYAVVTTGRRKVGYSGKLTGQQRKSLQTFVRERFADFPFGLVIRTNAGVLDEYGALEEEILFLQRQAEELLEKAKSRTCFSRLRSAPPLWQSTLRDSYHGTYTQIVTDDAEIYGQLKKYLEAELPGDLPLLSLYDDPALPLSKLYGLESKLREALDKKVWLKSGGYLVIEPTEALTVIDVNTGKFTGKGDVQETFEKINKEACLEIARQLILRNLSGIIIVDFINMDSDKARRELFLELKRQLAKDQIRTEAVDMTALGLVEITRKKVNKSLAEQWKNE